MRLKSLNKFYPWVPVFRLIKCLCQGNVFVLIFDLVQHVAPLFCSGHRHNYFLHLSLLRNEVPSIDEVYLEIGKVFPGTLLATGSSLTQVEPESWMRLLPDMDEVYLKMDDGVS